MTSIGYFSETDAKNLTENVVSDRWYSNCCSWDKKKSIDLKKKKSQKRIKILKDSVCLYNSVIEAFNRYLVETSGLCFPPIFHFMYKNILSKAVSPVQRLP